MTERDEAMKRVAASLNAEYDSGAMADNLDHDVQEMFETSRFASLLEVASQFKAAVDGRGMSIATLLAELSPGALEVMLKWLFSFAIFAVWERGKKLGIDDIMAYGLTEQCRREAVAILRRNAENA